MAEHEWQIIEDPAQHALDLEHDPKLRYEELILQGIDQLDSELQAGDRDSFFFDQLVKTNAFKDPDNPDLHVIGSREFYKLAEEMVDNGQLEKGEEIRLENGKCVPTFKRPFIDEEI